jgi:cytochrome b561
MMRNETRYTTTAIVLHWLVAVMILCAAGVGILLDDMKLSPQKLQLIASHVLLYALMLATPVVGWLQSSADGITVTWFNLATLPSPFHKDKEFAHQLMDIHAYLAFTILGVIVLHAAAAIKHHVIERDDVLVRMLPFMRQRQPRVTQEK